MDVPDRSPFSLRIIGPLCGLVLLGAAVVGFSARGKFSPIEAAQAVARSDEPGKTLLEVLQGRTPKDAAAIRLVNTKAKSDEPPALGQVGMGRGRNRLIPRRSAAVGPDGSASTEAFTQPPLADLLGAPATLLTAPALGDLDGLTLPAAEPAAGAPSSGGGLTLANPIGSLGDIADVPSPTPTPTSGPTTPVTAVPEPATWGLMVIGFLFVGAGMRRKVRPQRRALKGR